LEKQYYKLFTIDFIDMMMMNDNDDDDKIQVLVTVSYYSDNTLMISHDISVVCTILAYISNDTKFTLLSV